MNALIQKLVPLAFDIFQFCVGGTVAKRKLVMAYYLEQKHVLEVGCATGNIAAGFSNRVVEYTGVDIDEAAIEHAKRKFRGQRGFSFVCGELQNQVFPHAFDFIVFSSVLHHVNGNTATAMLECCSTILSPGGLVLVTDPLQPSAESSLLIKTYRKMERGKYMRTWNELSCLLKSLRTLRVVKEDCRPVTALPLFPKPTVSDFGVFLLKPCLNRSESDVEPQRGFVTTWHGGCRF